MALQPSPQRLHDALGEPISISPFATITTYNISIFFMLWYGVVSHWNLTTYVAWVRFNEDLLQDSPNIRLYLAAVVICLVNFWLISGPMFFYTSKYRKGMKDRNRWLTLGIVLSFVFSDVPLWMLDMYIVYRYGFINVTQVIAWTLRSISFLGNSFVSWHIYMHRVTKILQFIWGKGKTDLPEIARREEIKRRREQEGVKAEKGGLQFR